jgi:transaldolase
VQSAADEFRLVYEMTRGVDGYVSLEVNPHLAHDTDGTVNEARRLWRALDRPNVFIKIPATAQGLSAIQLLVSEGININVTLLFGLQRYRQVVEAYLGGIEERVVRGKPVKNIASVASFFVSRMDTLVDPILDKIIAPGDKKADLAKQMRGQVAIANARMAYQIFKQAFSSDRFKILAAEGAMVQRLLWASTGTKDPGYSDVKYIEALIGPDTINTVPLETLDAYRKHGDPKIRIEDDLEGARRAPESLTELGINLDKVALQLENEGVDKFIHPFDKLLATLTQTIAKH